MVKSAFRVKTWLNTKQVAQATREATTPRLQLAAFAVEAEAKRLTNIGGGKKGEASKPGEPPRKQTPNLQPSIRTAMDKRTFLIGPTKTAPYGKHLEFGTRKMAARPFMRPALSNARKKFPKLFRGMNIKSTPTGKRLDGTRGPL